MNIEKFNKLLKEEFPDYRIIFDEDYFDYEIKILLHDSTEGLKTSYKNITRELL